MDRDVMMTEEITVKCEDVPSQFDPLYIENGDGYSLNNEQQLKVYTNFNEEDLPGYKFLSVDEVFNFISQFEKYTGNKYWKRSTRTIQGANVKRQINQNLYYYEIKYTCVHGGLAFKSRSKGIRRSSSHKIGCPSQITFLASDDGQYLRIRSFNLKHESHFALTISKNEPREDGSESEQEADDWDDTALIKAYDKAINMAKEEVSKRMNEGNQPSQKRTKPSQIKQASYTERAGSSSNSQRWHVGDSCRAMYSEDGQIYEAVILEINNEEDTCTVEYLGYGNSESVELSSLIESGGPEMCKAQIKAAKTGAESQEAQCNGGVRNEMEYERQPPAKPSSSFSFESFSSMDIPPAPPLPPQLMAKLPENDTDALSSMLMSWYVSGFHTGYYHGLKHARENKNQSKR